MRNGGEDEEMRNRLSARLDKIEQRALPEKEVIYRRRMEGEDADDVLNRMVATGEITEDQRDCVRWIERVIVRPKRQSEQSQGKTNARGR